jgi:hypothetical protein
MTRKRKILLSASAVIVVLLATWLLFSLRRPEHMIRASLLRSTPLGSSSQQVRALLQSRGWISTNYIGSAGFLKQETGAPDVVVGATSLRGEIGSYRSLPYLFETSVTAFWGFDTNDHLIDVWVWKTTDGL